MGNIAEGISTYGFWEYVIFLDDLFYNAWMTSADVSGLGLCFGSVATAVATRLFFMPIGVYS